MKRTLVFLASFFLGTLAAFAQPASWERFENRLLEDVVKMTAAELPDSTIVAYVRARRARLDDDVTADDLIRLRRIGVGEEVVAAIARLTGIHDRFAERADDRDRDRDRDVTYDADAGGSSAVPLDPGYGAAYADPYGWPSVYDGPGWGYPYPYWYDYSPYFYGGAFFFRGGGRFHRGGGDHDRGHRGGGPRGGGDDKGGRGDTSRGGSNHSGASHGGSRSGGSHSGGSHGGGGHGRH